MFLIGYDLLTDSLYESVSVIIKSKLISLGILANRHTEIISVKETNTIFWRIYFRQKEGVISIINAKTSRRPANIRKDITHLPKEGTRS